MQKHALSFRQNPVAGFLAYVPTFSVPRSFTASPTAANTWDTDAFGHVFTNLIAHPFLCFLYVPAYRYKRWVLGYFNANVANSFEVG